MSETFKLIMSYLNRNKQEKQRAFSCISPEMTNMQAQAFAAVFEANGDAVLPGGLTRLTKAEKSETITEVLWPSPEPEPEDEIDSGVIPAGGPIPEPAGAIDSGVIPASGPIPEPAESIDSGVIGG